MNHIVKNSAQLLLASCLMFATGCSDNLINSPESVETSAHRFVLTACSSSPSTRMELGQDGITTQWQPGDQLVLLKKDGGATPIYLTTTITEAASQATFESDGGVPAGDYWVIYNYNDNRTYENHTFSTVDEINSQKKLAMYSDLTVTSETSSKTVHMQHMYAQITLNLTNAPNSSELRVGMYSTKKGFSMFKQFTANGFENADYGYNPNLMSSINQSYFPSKAKIHNLLLGSWNNYTYTEPTVEPTAEPSTISRSALVFPADLTGEDVYFYVIDGNTCYEVKKSNLTINAGTRYTVNLDLAEGNDNVVVTTLNTLSETITIEGQQQSWSMLEISTPAEWRHAAYLQGYFLYNGNVGVKVMDNINFTDNPFFPLNVFYINGNNKTIKNISLERENEDNVGLFKYEWTYESFYSETYTTYYMQKNNDSKFYACIINDLTLDGITVKGYNNVGAFGGINVRADNCKVIGTSSIVAYGDNVGGIVGWNSLGGNSGFFNSLTKVSMGEYCSVKGESYVGGIVGRYGDTNVPLHFPSVSVNLLNNCVSKAEVTATGNYVGGIFGKIGGRNENENSTNYQFENEDKDFSLVKCCNYGTVEGVNYVGGVGGELAVTAYCNNSTKRNEDIAVLKNSLNWGAVKGSERVGGILGSSMASINTCYSIKSVEGSTKVGGILGESMMMAGSSRIANCYSLATITTTNSTNGVAGGIVGNGGGGASGCKVQYSYYAGNCSTDCGSIGYSDGGCIVDHCLAVSSSLGTNLNTVDQTSTDEWGNQITTRSADTITDSYANVESILARKDVINIENAYCDNIWPLQDYPNHCVKFASFSAETDAPDFGVDTIN